MSLFGFGLSIAVLGLEPATAAHRQQVRTPAAPPIYVGGKKVDAVAFVENRRVFVPVRGVFEAIDASVDYVPPHFVIVRKDAGVIAAFILNRRHAIVAQQSVDLDVAPMRHDGRVYVPLRVVAEAAGARVSYTSRPPTVRIWPNGSAAAVTGAAADGARTTARQQRDAEDSPGASWRLGVVVVTALCCFGCLVLTARRFAPTLFRPRPHRVEPAAEREPPVLEPPPVDRVALTSVEATGEARFHREVVTETRTIAVPVTREELVIEYAGEGGTVIIEGRQLAAGETVRIALWEERVQVDITKHVLVTEDIVVGKRRAGAVAALLDRGGPPDFTLPEGNPS